MTAPSALAVLAARHFPSLNQCQVKLNKARFVETLPWPQDRIQTPLISGRHPEMSGFVSTGSDLDHCAIVPSQVLFCPRKRWSVRSQSTHIFDCLARTK
jgi:hypothetical protein